MAEIYDFDSFMKQKETPSAEMIETLHQETAKLVAEQLGYDALISYLEVSPLSDFGPTGTAQANNVVSLDVYRAQSAPEQSAGEWAPARRGRVRRLLGGFAARVSRGRSQKAA